MVLLMGLLLICTTAHSQTTQSDTVWVKEIGSEVHTVKFSPDGQYIYAKAIGRKPMKLNAENGEILMEYEGISYVDINERKNLDISKDGKYLYSGDQGNTLFIWDTETGNLVHTLNTEYQEKENPYYKSISVSGQYIAAMVAYLFQNSKGDVVYTTETHIWDVKTLQKVKVLQSFGGHTIKFSNDDKYLTYIKSSGPLLLSTENWNVYTEFNGHTGYVQDIAFSPDGSMLASGGSNGEIKIWDVYKKKIMDSIQDYGHLGSVAFAGNQYLIFKGSESYNPFRTKIWDIQNRKIVKSILTYPPNDIGVFKKNDYYLIAEAIGNYTILLLKFDPNVVTVIDKSDIDLSLKLELNTETRNSNLLIESDNEMTVFLEIFNINSEIIYTNPLVNLIIGRNELNFKSQSLSKGIYFCRISSKSFSKTFKFCLEK